MSKSWIRKAKESRNFASIRHGWEVVMRTEHLQNGTYLWTGQSRVKRILTSPLYLLAVLLLWFKGAFLGENHYIVQIQPQNEEQ